MDIKGLLSIETLVPTALISGLICVIAVIVARINNPDWFGDLLRRLHGDASTDAPPPEGKKKKKGDKNV